MLNFKKKIKKLLYSYFNPIQSFDWLTLNEKNDSLHIKKEGLLAVFTQTHNEGDLLLYWEKHYAKLVGHSNLFVINNGGSDNSCSRLNPKTSIINIMESTVFDNCQTANAHGYFQRFLLQHYKWVLKVDVDELMVYEGNLEYRLNQLSSGVYKPEVAIAVLHDMNSETSFDYERGITEQRSRFVKEHASLMKPSLMSEKATWGPGHHFVYEQTTTLPKLWMVHLRYFDFDRLRSLIERRSTTKVTLKYDEQTFGVSAYRNKDPDQVHDIAKKELGNMFLKDQFVIPEWLKKIF